MRCGSKFAFFPVQVPDQVLFTSIRQIFDHIFASENKVSEATFSNFLEISRKSRKFAGTEIVPKKLEMRILNKQLETVAKVLVFTSPAIHFSSQSGKYSNIFPPLKIKFLKQHFQNFQNFLKSSEFPKTSKCAERAGN